jgi:flavin-dependent dehydrogenase
MRKAVIVGGGVAGPVAAMWWCQLHPRMSRCLHSRASGEAIASVVDLQMG